MQSQYVIRLQYGNDFTVVYLNKIFCFYDCHSLGIFSSRSQECVLFQFSEECTLICDVMSKKVTVLYPHLVYLWILLSRRVRCDKSRRVDLMGRRFFSHHVFKYGCLSGLSLLRYDSVTRTDNDARLWLLSAVCHSQKCILGEIKPQISIALRRFSCTSLYVTCFTEKSYIFKTR